MTQVQSNSLGELYVDFKNRGSDVLMKNLRGISADFLLVKTAATQALKPIVSAGKESLQTGLEIGKMSSSLGITAKEYMRLKYYFKTKGLSEGLISDLENLSNQFQDVQRGVGNFSEGMMRAATTLGIDLSQYDGSFQSMEKLLGDIRERTKDWTPLQQKNILRDMGISPEWAYAFKQDRTNLSEAIMPTNQQLEQLIAYQQKKKTKWLYKLN